MRSLIKAARIRIDNERGVEKRIEDPTDSVMDKPVPNARFVYIARLRVTNPKVSIRAVTIQSESEFNLEHADILYEIVFEGLNVSLLFLISPEFSPRLKQIVCGNDIVV